ncbi:GNAT family N-acetyltransferase [Actinoplanes sp. GCM10030250]|uniref:GNAT family N-acetyltransferase n=1 Tax=Actinoplanes sp. GCM10030250 TaxID=3273376 RepID=UPI003617CA0B
MDISVVPANRASREDLRTIFGTRGEPARCQCQWFKITAAEWRAVPAEERARRLDEQTGCGDPSAESTSGLVAYVDGEPAGWCAVESRTAYPRLGTARVPWAGRDESRTDPDVWAVTCFVTRTGFRRRGVSRALAGAAVSFARSRGARALEGYPIVTAAGQEYSWGELYVGSHKIFVEAGFTEVSRPTPRRAVMRVDFSA